MLVEVNQDSETWGGRKLWEFKIELKLNFHQGIYFTQYYLNKKALKAKVDDENEMSDLKYKN